MNLDSADRAKAVVAQLLDRGILINRTQDTVLRFLPPYIIQKAHVDLVVRALDTALISTQSKVVSKAKPSRRSKLRFEQPPIPNYAGPAPPATATFPGRDLISIRDL